MTCRPKSQFLVPILHPENHCIHLTVQCTTVRLMFTLPVSRAHKHNSLLVSHLHSTSLVPVHPQGQSAALNKTVKRIVTTKVAYVSVIPNLYVHVLPLTRPCEQYVCKQYVQPTHFSLPTQKNQGIRL